jgi:hypothetical protein
MDRPYDDDEGTTSEAIAPTWRCRDERAMSTP